MDSESKPTDFAVCVTANETAEGKDGVGKQLPKPITEHVRWNAEDWEDYLQSLETEQKDSLLIAAEQIEEMADAYYRQNYLDLMEVSEHPRFEKVIGGILKKLTNRQREVVKLYFWGNKSAQEIAEALGVSQRQPIERCLDRAITRIRKELKNILAGVSNC